MPSHAAPAISFKHSSADSTTASLSAIFAMDALARRSRRLPPLHRRPLCGRRNETRRQATPAAPGILAGDDEKQIRLRSIADQRLFAGDPKSFSAFHGFGFDAIQ